MAKKKPTKAEHAEREAHHERVLANARRTRELAERAQARLDAERSRDRPLLPQRSISSIR
jgi:hypothetical protein